MKLSKDEKKLVGGSAKDVELFISDHGVHIDWRCDYEEMLADFAGRLPEGYLELSDITDVVVITGPEATATVSMRGQPPFGLEVGAAMAAVIGPDHEAHGFRDTLTNDTHSYLVRPRAWWDSFRAEYPRRYRDLFASATDGHGGYVLKLGVPEKKPPTPAPEPDLILAQARAALAKRLANAPRNAKRIAARRKAKLAAARAAKAAETLRAKPPVAKPAAKKTAKATPKKAASTSTKKVTGKNVKKLAAKKTAVKKPAVKKGAKTPKPPRK